MENDTRVDGTLSPLSIGSTVESMTATTSCDDSENRPVVRRAWASRTPKWQRFQPVMIRPTETTTSVDSKQKEIFAYQRQYSHVYHHRLMALRDRCWKALHSNNKDMYTDVNRILELREDQPSRIVGTLVKECADPKEKPFLESHDCRPSDQLYLEDESGRVVLSFEKDQDSSEIYQFCTGVVVGMEGTVDDKGILYVHRIVSPAPMPPPTSSNNNHNLAASPSEPAGHDPHVLLVSSLECGDPQVSSLPREMLVGYLQGQFTSAAAKVARIVVAGSGPSANDALGGLKEFDMFVGLQLAGSNSLRIPVDIVPSAKDPTTANWPQRPMHSSLLPLSTRDKKMVMTTPNPYEAVYGEKVVLGTDGLNVRDLQQAILKKPNEEDATEETSSPQPLTELEALEQTLRWAHLCPTGPDRLGMVPTEDPMVMDKTTPHLYFCGNCEEGFATKLINNGDDTEKMTRLVCIPKFSQTGEAVLVNLVSLDVELLRFKVDDHDDK
jgi:DNA polymerase delta subunit 2